MKKMIYNQQFINVVQPVGEKFSKPSLTVPGQDITVAEIYRRYGNGSLPNVQFESIDDPNESFDNESRFMDHIEAREASNQYFEGLAKDLDEAKKAQYEQAKRAQYQALKAELEPESVPSKNAETFVSAE